MTPTTPLDSGPDGGGSAGAPSSAASAGKGDSEGSGQAVTLSQADWEALNRRLQAIERGEQAAKDRAVRKTNERLDRLEGDFRSLLERAAQEGRSAKDVLTDIAASEEADARQALMEMAQAFRSGKFSPAGVGIAQSATDAAAQVFSNVGLDPKDPDVAVAMSEVAGKSPEAIELAAYRLKERKASQPNPKDAQSPAPRGGAPASQDKAAEIEAGYLDEVKTVRRGDIEHLARVKKKWRDKAREAGLLLNV